MAAIPVSKKMFFLLLLLQYTPLVAHYYLVTQKIDEIIIDTCIDSEEDSFVAYTDLITQMPSYLSWIMFFRDSYPSFTIIVPDNIEGVGPLDAKAPYIEGARTVLAWLQSYEKIFSENQLSYSIIKKSEYEQKTNGAIERIDCTGRDKNTGRSSSREHGNFIINPPWGYECSKKCFVITGGAGFIGSHLTKKILNLGHRVIVIDNLICSTGDNIQELRNNSDFLFVKHDVSEPFQISCHVDYIVHAASIPSPADYYRLPQETMAAGIYGTLQTLLLSIEHNARYLFMSTSEVYGDPEVHPQDETYAGNVNCMCSRSPYDQSKRGAETLIKLYYEKYHPDVRVARIFNTYGPGMRLHDGRVVTNFIAALLENKPMVIYGDGTQTRSLCYVDDMAEGLYQLLMCDNFTPGTPITERVFNLGNPEEYTIEQIVQEFQNLAKQRLSYPALSKKVENPDKADPRKRKPDITRAASVLHFAPQISFKEGLAKTFAYFMKTACDE